MTLFKKKKRPRGKLGFEVFILWTMLITVRYRLKVRYSTLLILLFDSDPPCIKSTQLGIRDSDFGDNLTGGIVSEDHHPSSEGKYIEIRGWTDLPTTYTVGGISSFVKKIFKILYSPEETLHTFTKSLNIESTCWSISNRYIRIVVKIRLIFVLINVQKYYFNLLHFCLIIINKVY